jgi:proteic killer suppression protein
VNPPESAVKRRVPRQIGRNRAFWSRNAPSGGHHRGHAGLETGTGLTRARAPVPGVRKAVNGTRRFTVANSCMPSLDGERPALLSAVMRIRNVVHKGLRRLIEDDDTSGMQPAVAAKIRRMVSFLQDMEREDELRIVPSWKAHQLTADRKGTWSLFVTKNWRMTFRIDRDEIEIVDLDYEDYH